MKRVMLYFVFAAIFAMPALASAEVHGIYIAPKFLLGIQDSGAISKSIPPTGLDPSFSQHSQAVFGGALAVGYNFAPKFNIPIRTEIEYALRSNSWNNKDGASSPIPGVVTGNWSTKHTLNISTLFINAYFDINTGTAFTPYIGGGLGMAFNYTGMKFNAEVSSPAVSVAVRGSKDTYQTTFAWNVGAGLSYAFTENISADIGYRFISTGYSESKANLTAYLGGVPMPIAGLQAKLGSSPYVHEFYLGARFTF